MKLIVNADDFAYSRAVNYGIIDAHRLGIVSSTSLMVNSPFFEHAIDLAKGNRGLGLGVHLNVTMGAPLSKGRSICGADGLFFSEEEFFKRLGKNEIDLDEIKIEFDAQIQKALASGLPISHCDSHHHVHMQEKIIPVFLEEIRNYNLAARLTRPLSFSERCGAEIRAPSAFSADFYGENASIDKLLEILAKNSKEDSLEIMCHPGYLDAELLFESSYNTQRALEHKTLCDATVLDYIKRNKIDLIHFALL